MNEILRTIPKFPRYLVSNRGNIFSLKRNKYLSLTKTSFGHLCVCLRKKGRSYTVRVHQLVLETYRGLCPPDMECRHLNGNPADNHLENLRWGTHANNLGDRIKHGTNKPGEESPLAKLTEQDVKRIRHYYRNKIYSARELAKKFNTHESNVYYILAGKTWKHILQ